MIDQIRAKYELLDSGECGDIDTPLFKAESCELAHLMARMSELCQCLNQCPRIFTGPLTSSTEVF